MAKNKYRITIKNWSKHQHKLKAGHGYFMFSKRFFDDESVADLKQNECLLYINLLCIAADMMSDSFTIHYKLIPNLLRIGDKSLQNCLDRLMENQLLTYEKMPLNIREYNIKDINIIEKKITTRYKTIEKPNSELNRKIWEFFSGAYFLRYKVLPIRNATVNGKISQIGKRLGEEAVAVVKFFVSHNDGYYLKNLHAIGLCLKDAESLNTQMLRGKQITSNDVRNFEKTQNAISVLKAIENGENF